MLRINRVLSVPTTPHDHRGVDLKIHNMVQAITPFQLGWVDNIEIKPIGRTRRFRIKAAYSVMEK